MKIETSKVVELLNRYGNAIMLPDESLQDTLQKTTVLSVVKAECQILVDQDSEYYRHFKIIPGVKHRLCSRKIRQTLIATFLILIGLFTIIAVNMIIRSIFGIESEPAMVVSTAMSAISFLCWVALIAQRHL